MIEYTCTCGHEYLLKDSLAGCTVECYLCHQVDRIPSLRSTAISIKPLPELLKESWATYKQWLSGKRVLPKETLKLGLLKIPAFLGMLLLLFILILGGSILFLIPGFIFMVNFSMAPFILFQENIGGMNALIKSRDYVWGNYWAMLWRLFVLGILLVFLLAIPRIGWICFALALPYSLIYLFSIYKDLKTKKPNLISEPTPRLKMYLWMIAILGFLFFPIGMALLTGILFLGTLSGLLG
jgi:hypothetical protein